MKRETQAIEFKETTGQRGEACRTLCAFLNGNGGVVVLGVSRKGKLVGQIVSDETKKDLARAFCDFNPGQLQSGISLAGRISRHGVVAAQPVHRQGPVSAKGHRDVGARHKSHSRIL